MSQLSSSEDIKEDIDQDKEEAEERRLSIVKPKRSHSLT